MRAEVTSAETIEVKYDLFSLPTAQHKAGLAGLLVLIESLRRRRAPDLPNLQTENGDVAITFTRRSFDAVFDDLFDATTEERREKQKWAKKEPIRIEEETIADRKSGKTKTAKRFVYNVTVSKAAFLKTLGMPEPWMKLWRDALWATLRGIPTTRLPFEQRAAGEPVQEAESMWRDLQRWQRDLGKGRSFTSAIGSALFVGAQSVNAEKVPSLGNPPDNLLLYFAPVVMSCWVPVVIDNANGESEHSGYVLAIPEVSDLEEFVAEMPQTIAALDGAVAGFRPRQALISLPQEGALEYSWNLLAIAKVRSGQLAPRRTIAAVEVFHFQKKRGNSIRILGSDRVPFDEDLLGRYETVRGAYRSVLFRGQLIRNLLRHDIWYAGFDSLLSVRSADLFLCTSSAHFSADQFARDARAKFEAESRDTRNRKEHAMTTGAAPLDPQLSERIHSMVRAYVMRRTEVKSGIPWDSFKDRRTADNRLDVPQRYREVRQKVCMDAFLALRGRRAREDFVAYFTGTVCSVPQYLPEAEYEVVAQALMSDRWEEAKALAMLALSACSNI